MKTFFQKGKLCPAQEKLWQGKHSEKLRENGLRMWPKVGAASHASSLWPGLGWPG